MIPFIFLDVYRTGLIEHHKTVSDYCHLLESIHVLHILSALSEHKLSGAPKKNRKLYYTDPFIHHAISCLLKQNYSFDEIKKQINQPREASSFIETIVIDHCKRYWNSFYIKGMKGEVDIAIIQDKKFYPIEIKWTQQIHPEDFKQINTYNNGIILSREYKKISRVVPIPRFLLHISLGGFIPQN
ncbi:putative ATPase [Candidatus Omnitrophus magneticus]|uniref:Putative ATPase n=1 Tax=Candidatus Omnitrophus magneticus TaxID=1609969 RepID=A0A0F0CMR8_9BACT|nr:putative ATPase [Candidatus Omnitrophus magneticus]